MDMLEVGEKTQGLIARYLPENIGIAQFLMRHNRARQDLFPDLFPDPSWDILLDLYVAEKENRPVSVSRACLASTAPPTSALRAVAMLCQRGMVRRIQDEQDDKRIYLRLSNESRMKVAQWVEEFSQFLRKASGDRLATGITMAND